MYLLDIKKFVDSLTVTRSLLSSEDHIEAILDDLPEENDSFLTFVILRLDPCIVQDIEAFLLAQEACFEKHRFGEPFLIQENVMSAPWSTSSPSRSSFRNKNTQGGCGSSK